ncbi:MAG: response regulator transcription factor [Bryobacteraceae bacterium]
MDNLHIEASPGIQQNGSQLGLARPKVLFLDDHRLVLDAVAFMAAHEYEVLTVDTLLEFEAAIDRFAPDLAILDIQLPGSDGFDAARRALDRRPELKLMFLSMYTEPRFVKRALEIGAHGYLSKRAPGEELMLAIGTVLKGGRYIGSRLQAPEEQLPDGGLTERQKEVLRLISQGCSAKEIANRLNISVRTAEFHRAAIMDRLKLHSTAMMTRYALDRGLA